MIFSFLLAGSLVQGTSVPPNRIVVATSQFLTRQADSWFEAGDFPAAISVLRYQYSLVPTSEEAVTDLGWMLQNVGRMEEAEALYKKFAIDAVGNPDRALPLAQYYALVAREPRKVIALLEPLIEEKVHPNNLRLLAKSYERIEDFKNAVRIYRILVQRFPEDLTAKRNLEMALRKLEG